MLRLFTALVLSSCLLGGCTKDDSANPKSSAPATRPQAPLGPAPGGGSGGGGVPTGPRKKSKLIIDGIGTEPARSQTAAEAQATGDQDCPKYIGQRSTAATMVGQHARTLSHELGWVFQNERGIKVFTPKDQVPARQYAAAIVPKGIAALDDEAWYIPRCKTGGCGPHGTGVVIDRVERTSQKATEVVPPQSEIVAAQILGEQLYWITFGPYGDSGELRRIPRTGGKVETLWRGRGMTAMLLESSNAIVADDSQVALVPLAGGKPSVLADGLKNVSALATDGDAVYIVEYGDRYHASAPSGYIKRVPRGGGDVATLAGPLAFPRVVAVDEHRVYYMLSEPGSIWAITKGAGGPPELLVPQPPRDATCLRSMWLRADDTGLIWFRKVEGFGKGELWRLNRKYLPPPPGTATDAFRRAMEEYTAAQGSAAGSTAPVGHEPDDDP